MLFLGCRRKSDEIEVNAAEQDFPGRFRAGAKLVRFASFGNEGVDGVA